MKEWNSPWNPFNSAKALMWRENFEAFAKGEFLKPVTVDTDPSSRCNYSCIWCNADTIIKQEGQKEISRDQLFRLSTFYAAWGVNSTCFTGDTEVKLVDGTHKTFIELVEQWDKNQEPFEVYSRDSKGKIVPGLAHSPRVIDSVCNLIELTLDTGEIVRCTPDHRFMLRDRTYKEARDLTSQDSLMPLYSKFTDSGYEILKEHEVGGLTHRVFGEYYYPGSIAEGKIFHHKNFNKEDNTRANLIPMFPTEHSQLHWNPGIAKMLWEGRDQWNASEEGKRHFRRLLMRVTKRFTVWAKSKEGRESSRKLLIKYNKSEKGRKTSGIIFQNYNKSLEGQLNSCIQLERINSNPEIVQKNNSNVNNIQARNLGKVEVVLSRLEKQGLDLNKENYTQCWTNGLPKWERAEEIFSYNHKVVSIRKIKLESPILVYCLTVETYHNFALSVGVFVENCVAGGGEPLLNKNTPDFLADLKKNGVESGLITNGSLIDDRTAEIIAQNCRWVGVSIDAATFTTYNKIKGLPEDSIFFGKVLGNIEKVVANVKRLGTNCDVCYKFLLHPSNAKEIWEAAKIAKSLGVRDFHLRPVGWDNLAKTKDHKAPDYTDLFEEIDNQIEEALKLEDENFHFYGIRHKFTPTFERKLNFSRCWAAPLILTFGADGNCHSCFDMRGREDLILCRHDPEPTEVLKHWNTQRHKDMIKNIDIEKCPRCTFGAYNEIVEKVFIEDSMCRFFP